MSAHRQRGFSLLEIVLVVVLAALAFTLVPRLFGSGVSGAELKSSVRSIASSMKLARDAAINTRREAFVTVNVQSHEVSTTFDSRVLKLHDDIALKLFTAQSDQISAGTASFRFYPDGSSNGGRVTLIANAREFAIDIDWLTGRVTVIDSVQTPSVAMHKDIGLAMTYGASKIQPMFVIPAKAGIQSLYGSYKSLDSRLRGNDGFFSGFQIVKVKQGRAL
jgi:general secretion pathway protein H